MRKFRFAVVAGLATAALVIVTAAPRPSSGVVGQIYVNDNTAGVNTVAGFDRHADGSLTAIPGRRSRSAAPARATATPRRARCS